MTGNLDLWNTHADIDPAFTKAITGKPYKGISPNPQYVILCLTDMFGPVGQGFGWEVIAEDFTPLGEEVLHWCRIRFWHTKREHSYEAYGQTKAYSKTRNGMSADEDAPKKSLTDAIIKAASQLGVAANIFLGRWDDQKYIEDLKAEQKPEPANKPQQPPKNDEARAIFTALQKDMRNNQTRADLGRWWRDAECEALRRKLPNDWQQNLKSELTEYGNSLPEQEAA